MKNILIVDDTQKIREIYRKLLTDEGYKVFEAPDVYGAIPTLNEESIDLVILDIYMPRISGSKLFELIKKSNKEYKIIVASVYPIDEQMHHIIGATDYYDKSHATDILIDKVQKALKQESFALKESN